jgi:hypothetical protein
MPFKAEDSLEDTTNPIDRQTLEALKRDSRDYGARGGALFFLTVVIGCALLAASYLITGHFVQELNDAKDAELMLVLLLVRGTLFGALSVAFLYGLFTVATAHIDQSTRFRKRLYSAHMLNYVFREFGNEIKNGTVTLRDVVAVFSAWNENVDSAFSGLKFQKKGKDLRIGGPNGRVVTIEEPSDNGAKGPVAP